MINLLIKVLQISNSIKDGFNCTQSKEIKIRNTKSIAENVGEVINLDNVRKEKQIEDKYETIIPQEIWNLILINSKETTFQITPPNYNCFRQEKPHWLEAPSLPWKIINNSIIKCQKWLEEQQEC